MRINRVYKFWYHLGAFALSGMAEGLYLKGHSHHDHRAGPMPVTLEYGLLDRQLASRRIALKTWQNLYSGVQESQCAALWSHAGQRRFVVY